MSNRKELNNKNLVRSIAEDKGYWHTNSWYQKECLQHGRTVSSSTVTRSIGARKSRMLRDISHIKDSAVKLLETAHNDYHLANWILKGVHNGRFE